MSNAQIIGVDQKTCPCCGGTEITIDNVPYPAGNNYFLAGQLPADFSLGVNPTFPIAVKLNWIIDTTVCFGKYIKVSKISRR